MRKLTFITAHNWETKRFGGFHKFAEAACNAGIDVVFFSFPRPYYGLFMHREQLNKSVVNKLFKGIVYNVGKGTLVNCTIPTLRIPDAITRHFPNCIADFFLKFSFSSFARFCNKFLEGTDCFIFESCEGIALIDTLKRKFPSAGFIYRPSDPLMYDGGLSYTESLEHHMLKVVDKCLLVNEEGLALYRRKIPDFDATVCFSILQNGVDIDSYTKTYPIPSEMNRQNTVLYVGAWEIEWSLICYAAERCPEYTFIVVCPNYPHSSILTQITAYQNIIYIPGIKPGEVPAWITNCAVVMVPYVTDFYKNRPLGITAKYYQAMAARKPIVAYCDTPELSKIGISVVYSYGDFVKEIDEAIVKKSVTYKFDLASREWSIVTRRFLDEICSIVI